MNDKDWKEANSKYSEIRLEAYKDGDSVKYYSAVGDESHDVWRLPVTEDDANKIAKNMCGYFGKPAYMVITVRQ